MTDKISVFAATENNRLQELLEAYLKENSKFILLKDINSDSELFKTLSALTKSVLIVDMSAKPVSFVQTVFTCCPACKIIALIEKPDVNFIVEVIRAGAKDIISYPIMKSEFQDVLNKFEKQFNETCRRQDKCKMISVFSNKGGIGKTSIASNLALELTKITKENVALVDLNFQLGDISTFLDLNPTFDISYMFENLNSLNKDLILSAMDKYKNTSLYVLASPPYFKQVKNVSPQTLAKLFEILKSCFSYIIIDTDSALEARTLTVFDYSDIVLLVTIVNLPALRNCRRCLDLFDKLGYDEDKIQILVNRYMENDEINTGVIENFLKKQIYWKIPNNYFAMMSSVNKGILLSELNSESNVAISFKELAMQVSDSVFRKNLIKKFSPDNIKRLNDIFRS